MNLMQVVISRIEDDSLEGGELVIHRGEKIFLSGDELINIIQKEVCDEVYKQLTRLN